MQFNITANSVGCGNRPVRIAVHAGSVHLDELISIALVSMFCCTRGQQIEILRVTDAELTSAFSRGELFDFVLDIGGILSPECGRFDHHQFPRDASPCCAASLLWEFIIHDSKLLWQLDFEPELLTPWFARVALLDSRGPFAVYKSLGLSKEQQDAVRPWLFEDGICSILPNLAGPKGETFDVAVRATILVLEERTRWAREMSRRLQALDAITTITTVAGVPTLVVDDRSSFGVDEWLEQRGHEDVAIVVSKDDRGDGWALYRRNDDKRVDFSLLEGKSTVAFAHRGGFIAKTAEMPLGDALNLCVAAVLEA